MGLNCCAANCDRHVHTHITVSKSTSDNNSAKGPCVGKYSK